MNGNKKTQKIIIFVKKKNFSRKINLMRIKFCEKSKDIIRKRRKKIYKYIRNKINNVIVFHYHILT